MIAVTLISGGDSSGKNLINAGRMEVHGFHDEAVSSLGDFGKEVVITYVGGKVIGGTIKYLRPASGEAEVIISRSVGADINTTNQVLQRGGQSLTKKTLDVLKLTKEQGRNAIHSLKKDLGLGNDYHGVIRSNGDYYDPSNKTWIGNLFDYLD